MFPGWKDVLVLHAGRWLTVCVACLALPRVRALGCTLHCCGCRSNCGFLAAAAAAADKGLVCVYSARCDAVMASVGVVGEGVVVSDGGAVNRALGGARLGAPQWEGCCTHRPVDDQGRGQHRAA